MTRGQYAMPSVFLHRQCLRQTAKTIRFDDVTGFSHSECLGSRPSAPGVDICTVHETRFHFGDHDDILTKSFDLFLTYYDGRSRGFLGW